MTPTFNPEDSEPIEKDSKYYGPGGIPWCSFKVGSLYCTNGDSCKNPNHRREEDDDRYGDQGSR